MDEAINKDHSLALLNALAADIKMGVGRIASNLESETRFRDGTSDRFDKINETLYGNGKIGLVRQVDKIEIELTQLKTSMASFLNRAERILSWVVITLLAVGGKILWGVVGLYLKKVGLS